LRVSQKTKCLVVGQVKGSVRY